MKGLAWFGAILLGVLVLGAIVFGGWEAGWWFRNQNVNRESHLFRNSYGNQQTLRDQITQRIGDVLDVSTQISQTTKDPATSQALIAQRKAIVNIVCSDAAQVVGDPLNPDQTRFVQTNCEAGSISPNSPYDR